MTIVAAASPEFDRTMKNIGAAARQAAEVLARADPTRKAEALFLAAAEVRAARHDILSANAEDLAAAEKASLSTAMRDRLLLDDARVEAMAEGLEAIAAQPDPVGAELARWKRTNGLDIARVRVPLGVIGIIYESRPNVTADAAGLCLRAGNAAILRCGSESFRTSRLIESCLRRGITSIGLPETAVQLVPTRDREAVGLMLAMVDVIDIIVPRGGRSLIERVQRESRIPVIAHLEGLCHTYVDQAADVEMARRIVLNAKMRRTGVCGATETLLVDRAIAVTHLPLILADLHATGCEIRGDAETRALDPLAKMASEADWATEYLDAILSVRVVNGVDGAVAHIRQYGSQHTDAIVTENPEAANRFIAGVESAIVLVNASTQFADGGARTGGGSNGDR